MHFVGQETAAGLCG